MRKSNPKITETFADLKRDLAETMTAEDWEVSPSPSRQDIQALASMAVFFAHDDLNERI